MRMCWAIVPNSNDTTAIEARSVRTAKMRPPVEIGFGREEEIVVICELVQNRASPFVCRDLRAWRAPPESIEHEGSREDQNHRDHRKDGHPRYEEFVRRSGFAQRQAETVSIAHRAKLTSGARRREPSNPRR